MKKGKWMEPNQARYACKKTSNFNALVCHISSMTDFEVKQFIQTKAPLLPDKENYLNRYAWIESMIAFMDLWKIILTNELKKKGNDDESK